MTAIDFLRMESEKDCPPSSLQILQEIRASLEARGVIYRDKNLDRDRVYVEAPLLNEEKELLLRISKPMSPLEKQGELLRYKLRKSMAPCVPRF